DEAELAAGSVEGRHRRIRDRPPEEGVEPPAVLVVAFTRRPGPFAIERRLPEPRRLRGVDRWAADLTAQETAQGQSLVANRFGLKAIARPAAQESIPRVLCQFFWRDLGGLPVSLACDEKLERGFRVPTEADVLGRQPIEKFGV